MDTPMKKTRRAPGIVMLSFPAPEKLKKEITRLARAEGHTNSEWMRLKLWALIRRHYAATTVRKAA